MHLWFLVILFASLGHTFECDCSIPYINGTVTEGDEIQPWRGYWSDFLDSTEGVIDYCDGEDTIFHCIIHWSKEDTFTKSIILLDDGFYIFVDLVNGNVTDCECS